MTNLMVFGTDIVGVVLCHGKVAEDPGHGIFYLENFMPLSLSIFLSLSLAILISFIIYVIY